MSFVSLDSARTTVSLLHDDFARHGDDAKGYRDAMASAEGWAFILQRYVQAEFGQIGRELAAQDWELPDGVGRNG